MQTDYARQIEEQLRASRQQRETRNFGRLLNRDIDWYHANGLGIVVEELTPEPERSEFERAMQEQVERVGYRRI